MVGMTSKQNRIDEIIGLVHKVRPEALARLRLDYPGYEELFKVGQTMGGSIPQEFCSMPRNARWPRSFHGVKKPSRFAGKGYLRPAVWS